jgi:hypothetical protein
MIKRKITGIGIALSCLALGAGCSDDDKKCHADEATCLGTSAPTGSGGATGGLAGSPAMTGSGGAATATKPVDTGSKPATAGSGGAPDMTAQGSGGTGSTPTMLAADTPWAQVPESCKGFEVLGLKESPGGAVLPNKCAPFHGTYNNPYAIRCIDADPTFKTNYPGDEYCILPPPAALGTQVHVGPEDYNNPGPFEFPAGQEINTYYYINASNDADQFYYRVNWRMRPGSHHMIISLMDNDRADGWAGSGEARTDLGVGGTNFGGAQRPDVDRPQGTLDIPPENVGLGGEIKAHQQFSFNLHHMNQWEYPILREAWVNIWYMPESEVTKKMQGLTGFGNPLDVAVAPGESAELEYACDVTQPTRIISLLGHRHVSTDRFAAWIERANGDKVDAYESFKWEDIPTYQYDSVSMNPVPNVEKRIDGASSGTLELSPGDSLHFECDIHNQQDQTLRFANELYTGEMCILFGSYTGANPCGSGAGRVPH